MNVINVTVDRTPCTNTQPLPLCSTWPARCVGQVAGYGQASYSCYFLPLVTSPPRLSRRSSSSGPLATHPLKESSVICLSQAETQGGPEPWLQSVISQSGRLVNFIITFSLPLRSLFLSCVGFWPVKGSIPVLGLKLQPKCTIMILV